jgi:hypothetical protein
LLAVRCRNSGVLLILLVLVLLAPTAHAAEPVARPITPGCKGAPVWRIGYRLYWVDTRGREASRAAYPTVLEHAREFTERVGTASRCAVRVRLDIYDMGRTRWPATRDWKRYPPDTEAFQKRHGYDAVFTRFPEMGDEGYSGVAHGGRPLDFRAKFPGSRNPLTNWGVVEPRPGTLWHEWMHLVVGFYDEPRLGWPKGDVHGGCGHGYADACQVGFSEAYFADMMTGRVVENGKRKGLLPREWAYYGTPTRPRHQNPGLYVRVGLDGGNVGWSPGVKRVLLTYTHIASGRVAYRQDITNGATTLLPPVPPGVCVRSEASLRFRAGRACDVWRVRPGSAQATG